MHSFQGRTVDTVITVQFLYTEPQFDQIRSAVFPELAFVQHVRDGERERETEGGLDKDPAIQVNQDGGVGHEDLHDAQTLSDSTSTLGGSSMRRLSS